MIGNLAMADLQSLVLSGLLLLGLASAYYVPGTYPQEFRQGAILRGEDRRLGPSLTACSAPNRSVSDRSERQLTEIV